MNYVKTVDNTNLIVLAVDKWVFERDVDRGFLGEAVAGRLIFPCPPIANESYLLAQEVILKKRLTIELLQNLVSDFPELSYELHIKPEYFLYETLLRRARVFPPMVYNLKFMLEIEREDMKQRLHGFTEALSKLEAEGKIYFSNGFVMISKQFAEAARSIKTRLIYQFKTAQRTLFNTLLNILPNTLTLLSQNRELLLRLQKSSIENSEAIHTIKDPLSYVLIPTANGLVPLSSRVNIEAFSRKVLSADKNVKIEVNEIGGVLNDVYLIRAFTKDGECKAVVKKFMDWSGFKWFPLTLWSVGTRTFAVLGKSRLEKEVAINQQLLREGFNVPKILHVSPNDRLVFMEYVEGKNLNQIIKKIANSKTSEDIEKDLEILRKVGEKMAKAHKLNIALGDTKPENFLIGKNSEIFMLDFEQASRNGDKVWDVAEFLYYVGHYIPPLAGPKPAERISKAFIEGYLKAGGDPKTIAKAANPKYTKVFSIFVFPHIIFTISNICKNPKKKE